MLVSPINNIDNTSFNGRVSKKVIKFINAATDNEIRDIVENVTFHGKVVDLTKIKQLKELSNNLVKKLSELMLKTHRNTVLEFSSNSYSTKLQFRNKKISKNKAIDSRYLYSTSALYGTVEGTSFSNALKIANERDIELLDSFADYCKDHIENFLGIDKHILDYEIADLETRAGSEHGIERFFALLRAKRKLKVAKEVRPDYDIVTGVKNRIKHTKEKISLRKQNMEAVKNTLREQK